MAAADTSKEDEILSDAKEAFQDATDHEAENRRDFLDDIRFGRLSEQWPEEIKRQRMLDERPCLTANQLPSFVRRVINNARQNKPGITVHPVDSNADPETADIINGLIRQIEQSSDAEVAYDTALDNAVTGGWGYFKINTRYACDDTFDQDIVIEAVPNPLSIYGDPHSTATDSSDWMTAFELDRLSKRAFKSRFKDADAVSFDYPAGERPEIEEDEITIASYWEREEVARKIVAVSMPHPDADPGQVMTAMALGVSDNLIIDLDVYQKNAQMFQALGMKVMGQPRSVPSYKVRQRILSGADVLETIDWAGKYIPIIPVYGEDINVEGKRHLRSLIRDAKDLQMMFNFWRTAATEMVALAPKAPFIGKKGAFISDAEKWDTINTQSWAYVEYDGAAAPERQPFAGVPTGILAESSAALEDMKSILGVFNAVEGTDNESSGRALLARQKQSDIGSFHFIDNLSRAIRHGGRVILDLIPKTYSTARVIRYLGQDGTQKTAKIAPSQPPEADGPEAQPAMQPSGAMPSQGPMGAPGMPPQGAPMGQPPMPQPDPEMMQQAVEIERIYDLTVGKYDLTVQAGPSYATQREELNTVLIELIRAYPPAAPAIMDLVVKTLDVPDADEVVERIQKLAAASQGQGDPKAQQAMQQLQQQAQQALDQAHGQIQQIGGKLQQTQQQLAEATSQQAAMEMALKNRDMDIKGVEANAKLLAAQTDAKRADNEAQQAAQVSMMGAGYLGSATA